MKVEVPKIQFSRLNKCIDMVQTSFAVREARAVVCKEKVGAHSREMLI